VINESVEIYVGINGAPSGFPYLRVIHIEVRNFTWYFNGNYSIPADFRDSENHIFELVVIYGRFIKSPVKYGLNRKCDIFRTVKTVVLICKHIFHPLFTGEKKNTR